jgi:lambda family phage portal protein
MKAHDNALQPIARGPTQNIVGAEQQMPRTSAAAFTAGSWDHPDMRRWAPYPGSADTDLLPELGTIRSRSRDLARNHGVAEGALQTLVDNVVGSGLRLKSRPNRKSLGWSEEYAEAWSNQVEALWSEWAESTSCDAARSLNFTGLTVQAFRSCFINGEALALPLWRPRRGTSTSTCLQMVEPDRLMNPNGQTDHVGLRGGIEVDAFGAPLAYWIAKTHPGDRYQVGAFSSDCERIPAFTAWGRRRVIHVHDRERAGQSRGKPHLASVLRQFRVLGEYTNAELKAAVVNAMVAIVTKSSMGQEQLVELLSSNPEALKAYQEGLSKRGRGSIDFNAGMIVPLALGEDFASFTPARPVDSFEPFTLTLFRHIAAGLNIPYELLMKDFSKTNYSSARAALLEGWRFFRGRRKWLTAYWAQPVFELWFEEMVETGQIEAPGFLAKRASYCRAKWIGDGRGWIDPLKEASAAEKRIQIGLTTLEDEVAEQGGDWEEVLEQRAREERRARSLGLTLPWMTGAPRPALPPMGADKTLDDNEDEAGNKGNSSGAYDDYTERERIMRQFG